MWCKMYYVQSGNEMLGFKTSHSLVKQLFDCSEFLYIFLTTAEGNAIIIRVQGRLAQLVRALR